MVKYPYQTYVAYLETKLQTCIAEITNTKTVQETERLLVERDRLVATRKAAYTKNPFFFEILDLLYAGERELAQTMCTPETFQQCETILTNLDSYEPPSEIYYIYKDWAENGMLQMRKETDER